MMLIKSLIVFAMTAAFATGQRPSFAGSRPIGYPELITTSTEGLGNRFGEGDATTQRLPIEANGDRNLIDRLSKLPVDKQPFWFINWQAYEAHRQKPQTFPQKPNDFNDPIPNSGSQNFQSPNQVNSNPQANQFAGDGQLTDRFNTDTQPTSTTNFNSNPQFNNPNSQTVNYPNSPTVNYPNTQSTNYPNGQTTNYPNGQTLNNPNGQTVQNLNGQTLNYPTSQTVNYPNGQNTNLPNLQPVNGQTVYPTNFYPQANQYPSTGNLNSNQFRPNFTYPSNGQTVPTHLYPVNQYPTTCQNCHNNQPQTQQYPTTSNNHYQRTNNQDISTPAPTTSQHR